MGVHQHPERWRGECERQVGEIPTEVLVWETNAGKQRDRPEGHAHMTARDHRPLAGQEDRSVGISLGVDAQAVISRRVDVKCIQTVPIRHSFSQPG